MHRIDCDEGTGEISECKNASQTMNFLIYNSMILSILSWSILNIILFKYGYSPACVIPCCLN